MEAIRPLVFPSLRGSNTARLPSSSAFLGLIPCFSPRVSVGFGGLATVIRDCLPTFLFFLWRFWLALFLRRCPRPLLPAPPAPAYPSIFPGWSCPRFVRSSPSSWPFCSLLLSCCSVAFFRPPAGALLLRSNSSCSCPRRLGPVSFCIGRELAMSLPCALLCAPVYALPRLPSHASCSIFLSSSPGGRPARVWLLFARLFLGWIGWPFSPSFSLFWPDCLCRRLARLFGRCGLVLLSFRRCLLRVVLLRRCPVVSFGCLPSALSLRVVRSRCLLRDVCCAVVLVVCFAFVLAASVVCLRVVSLSVPFSVISSFRPPAPDPRARPRHLAPRPPALSPVPRLPAIWPRPFRLFRCSFRLFVSHSTVRCLRWAPFARSALLTSTLWPVGRGAIMLFSVFGFLSCAPLALPSFVPARFFSPPSGLLRLCPTYAALGLPRPS